MDRFRISTSKKSDKNIIKPSTENDQFQKLKRDGIPLREDVIHEAKKGNPRALNNIGSAYYSKGGKSNYAKALMWYEMAAENGNPQAQNMIGTMYQQGKGTRKSDISAIEYYLKSAKQGYPKAMSNLAMMYRHGFGTGVNHLKAIMWYSKAANNGESLAQYNIETMYKEHPLSNDEYKKLVQLHTEEAEQGNPYAEYNLGIMYRDGRGVNADKEIAMDWFVKSAMQGHNMALTELPKDERDRITRLCNVGGGKEKTGSGTASSTGSGASPTKISPVIKPSSPATRNDLSDKDVPDKVKQKIKDQADMLQVLQDQMQRDKWEKDQMMKKISELTVMVEALTRNYKGSSSNSDPASPGSSVLGTIDLRRISEYVGDQLNHMDGIATKESEDDRERRLWRERERRDHELEQLKREYEARIRQLREEQQFQEQLHLRGQQIRGQPSRERQNQDPFVMPTHQPQEKGLLLEEEYPHKEQQSGPFQINDDPAHFDPNYDSEPEDQAHSEGVASNHSRTNSFKRAILSNSSHPHHNNSDNASVYSSGQLNSNSMSISDQASVFSNGYPNNYVNDRASTFSEGVQSNFGNSNDRSRMFDYGIQSNYISNERSSISSNGHPSPYSINSNSSNSSTVGPTTVYNNPINVSPPPMFGNAHLYSTSPVNGYIYSGMNSGYTSSSHRSHHEDEDQLTLERRQSELDAHYTELMEMAQKPQ